MKSKIEFISYTGKYPNLCRGILTVKIDGKEYKFGHDSDYYNLKTNSYDNEDPKNPNFENFWTSGGHCGFKRNYSESFTKTAKWQDNGYYDEPTDKTPDWEETSDTSPEWISELIPDLLKAFNENVEYGCCGGCL